MCELTSYLSEPFLLSHLFILPGALSGKGVRTLQDEPYLVECGGNHVYIGCSSRAEGKLILA